MKIEIERKFLVANDGWRNKVTGESRMRDGLIARADEGKARVRIEATRATITIKSPREGFSRFEYEFEIPLAEAEHMLAAVCGGQVVEKIRYLVPHAGLIWEVDVYEGALRGVVLAEVELDRVDQPVDLPEWLGREVTGDPTWSKLALLRRAQSPNGLVAAPE